MMTCLEFILEDHNNVCDIYDLVSGLFNYKIMSYKGNLSFFYLAYTPSIMKYRAL